MRNLFTRAFFAVLFINLCFSSSVSAQVTAWGYNLNGQIGSGSASSPQFNPVNIGLPQTTGIGGGNYHTLLLQADGTILAVGKNDYGQIGNNTSGGSVLTPTAVSSLTGVVQVTGGGSHSAALKSDGTVWVWGNGKLIGNGTANLPIVSTPTQTSIFDVVQIDAGDFHTLALKSDGTVWAWGYNGGGQLGDNSTTLRSAPVQVGVGVSDFSNIIAVSAGDYHSMALKSDGTVWVWGENNQGQVGNGLITPANQFTPVQNTTLASIVQISAGGDHNAALRNDGKVFVWGNNYNGQIGNGVSDGIQLAPIVNATLQNIIDLKTSGSHTIARRRDGTVWAWGYNEDGEIGNGTTLTTGCACQPSPVQSSVGAGNAIIGAGYFHNFAAKPQITTGAGNNVSLAGDNLKMIFSSVTGAGTTSYTAIDPTATGLTIPAGYAIVDNSPAYNITTTATTAGSISVCLKLTTISDQSAFNRTRLLHGEGAALVDRTSSRNYQTREICAATTSLSPFVVAQQGSPSAASVSIGGRITTGNNRSVSRAAITLTDSEGRTRTAATNSLGYYRFDEVSAGAAYIVSVTTKQYSFTPQTITVTEELTDLNFTVEP